MVLDQELAYFDKQRKEWLHYYNGQVALVKGEKLYGTFTTISEAFDAGVHLFGTQPFLIKEIEEEDKVIQYPALSVGILSAR